MNVAIYARVSTADQNCQLQLTELREYCARRQWTIHKEYVDTGWSGSKASRPALDRLMKDAAEHRFDAVAVWKLDRFGRSVLNLVEAIQKLTAWGIRFTAVTQSIDTDNANPTSQLMLHILAAVAEFEREMIRERVKAGMKAASDRGVRCGRRKEARDLQRILSLRNGGASIRAIAAQVGTSRATVARELLSHKVS